MSADLSDFSASCRQANGHWWICYEEFRVKGCLVEGYVDAMASYD